MQIQQRKRKNLLAQVDRQRLFTFYRSFDREEVKQENEEMQCESEKVKCEKAKSA